MRPAYPTLTRRPDSSERGNRPRAFHAAASFPGDGAGIARAHGEGRQRVSQGGNVMSEDALVNTGAAGWPHPDSAYFAVRRMQAKLHRWATEDPGRRFGDLFNEGYSAIL